MKDTSNNQKQQAPPPQQQIPFNQIKHGDKVTILVPNGFGRFGQEWREKSGRAIMRGPAGWVLNMGGPYGTAGVATERNFVKAVR